MCCGKTEQHDAGEDCCNSLQCAFLRGYNMLDCLVEVLLDCLVDLAVVSLLVVDAQIATWWHPNVQGAPV